MSFSAGYHAMATEQYSEYSMRPMRLSDVDAITEWSLNFDDTAFFERNLPVPVGPDHISDSWKSILEFHEPPKRLWFIAENASKEAVGMCGLESINYIHGDAVLPVFVEKKSRAKGLAVRMACPIIDLAFDTLRLHRLSTQYRADHPVSPSITSKVGFKEEGRARGAWYSGGTHLDVVQAGLLKTDWYSLRDTLREELVAAKKPILSF